MYAGASDNKVWDERQKALLGNALSQVTVASDWWVRGFGHLLYSVETGKSGFEKSLGMPLGAEEAQVEAAFREAIATAQQQKSISLEKRAEATYAEYRRQKASGSAGRGFRLPIC